MRASLKCFQWSALTLAALVIVPILFTSCGKESIADAVTRQKDRERENASVVGAEYDTVGGNYAGSFTSSNPKARGGFDSYVVTANLKTIRVPKDGNIIAQPVISGSFVLTDKNRVLRGGKPMTTVFSFSNGSYDSATRQLTVVINSVQGTPAITVNCKKDSNEDPSFHCSWLSLISDVHFEFLLARSGQRI